MNPEESTVTVGEEWFGTMVLIWMTVVFSPIIRMWLLSKRPARTVNLFAASLPLIVLGTWWVGIGPIDPLFTSLFAWASWKMCVAMTPVMDLSVLVVTHGAWTVYDGIQRSWTTIVLTFRAFMVTSVLMASVAYPRFDALLAMVTAAWMVHQAVRAARYLVQSAVEVARAAAVTAKEAMKRVAHQAIRAVQAAAIAALLHVVSVALHYRKTTATLVVTASLACPPFGVGVMVTLVSWTLYQLVQAVVWVVQSVVAAYKAACLATHRAVDKASTAVQTFLSALFRRVLSWLVSALMYSLQMACNANFLLNPTVASFAMALTVKVVRAVLTSADAK